MVSLLIESFVTIKNWWQVGSGVLQLCRMLMLWFKSLPSQDKVVVLSITICKYFFTSRIAANFDGAGSVALTKRDYFAINVMQIWSE